MLSVRDIQKKTLDYFTGKGVPNPKLDTDLLIAHVLGVKRLELYLDIDRPLSEAELSALRPLVKRRAHREPLQYILGTCEFWGMPLQVDARALIPRPETEELVELIRLRVRTPPERILDLGTGSGAIAIALATLFPDAEVWATDQSTAALELAQENAATHLAANRIHFHPGSWWDALPAGCAFDLIVSNPPYLTEAEMQTAEPEVVANEPQAALVAGPDGLKDLRQIIAGAARHLAPGGLLALETGIAQHGELDSLATEAGLSGQGLCDMSGRPRFYFATAAAAAPGLARTGAAATGTAQVDAAGHEQSRMADAGIPTRKPNSANQPGKGRASAPQARYFITCYTRDRTPGLETEDCAVAILTAIRELHTETSIDLLAATVMPDHIHLLLRLGRRLELSQVIAKFKALTCSTLEANGLAWQQNDDNHRLHAEDAAEKFSKYIFLNPYHAGVIPLDEVWPWWVKRENYQPEFLTQLEDPPRPPATWLGESVELEQLLDEDR